MIFISVSAVSLLFSVYLSSLGLLSNGLFNILFFYVLEIDPLSSMHDTVSQILPIFRFFFLSMTTPLWTLATFFSFLILYTVGRTPWTGNQPVTEPLSTQNNTNTE
jgi:hypothetical protein